MLKRVGCTVPTVSGLVKIGLRQTEQGGLLRFTTPVPAHIQWPGHTLMTPDAGAVEALELLAGTWEITSQPV